MRGRFDLKVWTVNLDRAAGDLSVLSTEEHERAARLKRARDCIRSLEAHCALRHILAYQLNINPGCLEFGATPAGKPYLTKPVQNLEFNLSHSASYGLIAVAMGRSVGVDIEVQRPISDLSGVARQIMTTQEARLWSRSQTRSAFFDLWSRKEAILKAVGSGLLIDPRELEVGIGQGRKYIKFGGRIWTVASLSINSGVSAALAIEGELESGPIVRSL